MDPGKALVSSLEVIKAIYETAELYRRLEKINQTVLNEIALLVSLQEQIKKSKRLDGNPIIDNYLIDINNKLIKIKNLVENVQNQHFVNKIIYTRKIKKISHELGVQVKKLKFLLEIKSDLQQSSKLDISNIILDIKGRIFWENNFGSDHLIVQQNIFFSAIRLTSKLLSNEIDFLKKVINDDNDKYISAFEFQEWLDIFGEFDYAFKRTIDSLFDPSTYECYQWYQRNVQKNLIKTILIEIPFIVRKHTTQRNILIANFYYGQNNQLCNLYIKNKDNLFHLEYFNEMNPFEFQIFNLCNKKISPNLKDIVSELQLLINPAIFGIYKTPSWDKIRENHADIEIHSSSNQNNNQTNQNNDNIFDKIKNSLPDLPFSIPIPNLNILELEMPKIPDLPTLKNMEDSVEGFFNCMSSRKK